MVESEVIHRAIRHEPVWLSQTGTRITSRPMIYVLQVLKVTGKLIFDNNDYFHVEIQEEQM